MIVLSALLCVATIVQRHRSIHTATDSVGFGRQYFAYTSNAQATVVMQPSAAAGSWWYDKRDHQFQCPSTSTKTGLTTVDDCWGPGREWRIGVPMSWLAGAFSLPPVIGIAGFLWRWKKKGMPAPCGFELIPNPGAFPE